MAIEIAIGADLETYSISGISWAKVRCTNGAAPDWRTEVTTDGDGFATISGVVTNPHEQGFILRWNAAPDPHTLLVITHGGGEGLFYGNQHITTGRLISNGGIDWLDLEDRGARIVDIKWFENGIGQGWFSRVDANPLPLLDCSDRITQVMEWIHRNLNPRQRPIALIGSSGGAEAVLSPFVTDSVLLKPKIHYVCPASYPGIFWDCHSACHNTGTENVDPDTLLVTNNPSDPGASDAGQNKIDYLLTTTKCSLGTVTVGELIDFSDVDALDAITPWYQGTLHVTVGLNGGAEGGDVPNGVVYGAGNLAAHAFWQHARVERFSSATDLHGQALDTITSEGFAEVHARLAALADGEGLAMATYNKFHDFVEQLVLAKHDFGASGHQYKAYLTNAAPSASGDSIKTDLAEISATGGYVSQDIQNSVSETGGTVTITVVDVVWTATGGTIGPFEHVAIFNETQTSPVDPLVNYWTYPGGALTLQDGETFTVDFGSNTLFTLA